MQIKEFTEEKKWVEASIEYIKELINFSDTKKSEKFRIALSGGGTPVKTYRALSQLETLSDKVAFYIVDERYVPPPHPDSNQKMIRETLINPHERQFAKTLEFHHFDTTIPIENSLKKYEKQLPKNGFDLTILGIGPDGHIASLFPHSPALNSKEKTTHSQTDTFAIKDRLTITYPEIMKSKNILILLKNKPQILAELKTPTKSAEEFPARKLLEHDNLIINCLRN